MKNSTFARLFVVLLLLAGFAHGEEILKLTPVEAAAKVTEGKAVLVDVREPDEWAETGVAGPAILLSKSDFEKDASSWKTMLEDNSNKTVILYCRSGNRAGIVAEVLAKRGFDVANAGSFEAWEKAGLPTRKVAGQK